MLPVRSKQTSGKGQGLEAIGLSERDCKILLRYLERDKKVLVADEKGEVRHDVYELSRGRRHWILISSVTFSLLPLVQVYKIVPLGTDANEVQVTEADRGTVAIMATLDKLDKQIEGIHQELIRYVSRSPFWSPSVGIARKGGSFGSDVKPPC